MKKKRFNIGLIKDLSFIILIILLDQFTKMWARGYLKGIESIKILGNFFVIVYVENRGAGFGILQNFRWPLVFFSLFVLGVLVYYWDRVTKNKVFHVAAVLIFAGVIGNLIDRMFLGYVTDFIGIWKWPVFNFADSSAFIGTMILLYYMIIKKEDLPIHKK